MFKKILGIVAKVADNAVTGGIVHNAIETTETHAKGKVNWVRFLKTFFKFSLPFILIMAFIFGKITLDDLKALLLIF